MAKFKVSGSVEAFVKRCMYLAWRASQVCGMGELQDRGDQPEDAVWQSMCNRNDYLGFGKEYQKATPDAGMVDADYVNGRMMKLLIKWQGDVVDISGDWQHDYQSFCHAYKNPKALANAAAKELGVTAKPVA